jgi:hypothetical protein
MESEACMLVNVPPEMATFLALAKNCWLPWDGIFSEVGGWLDRKGRVGGSSSSSRGSFYPVILYIDTWRYAYRQCTAKLHGLK